MMAGFLVYFPTLFNLLQRNTSLGLPHGKFTIPTNLKALNQLLRDDDAALLPDTDQFHLLSFTGTTTTLDTLFHP